MTNGWIEEIPHCVIGNKIIISVARYKLDLGSYTWAAIIDYFWDVPLIRISGVIRAPRDYERKALKEFFHDKGIHKAIWDRRIGARPRSTGIIST